LSLAESLIRFVRVLRATGIPVGADRLIVAARALTLIGMARRDDVYWTLVALLLSRHEQLEVFDQAFRAVWEPGPPAATTAPGGAEAPTSAEVPDDIARRVLEALAAEATLPDAAAAEADETEALVVHASAQERLQRADFGTMTLDELKAARRLIARLRLPIPEMPTRRRQASPHGPRIDLRATFRAGLRTGGEIATLRRSAVRRRAPPLVVLCDVSGSMQQYARMFLHFLHAVTNDRDRVHVFLFGTRLTPVTRQLRHRDVDAALRAVAEAVPDWSGGTRISASLAEFNLRWARRVLGQNAVVLLITDGLDRDGVEQLEVEADRLGKACRRLLWLNPLLRFDGFAPKAAGIRALLPHVDAFLPAHNLRSLEDLAQALVPSRRAVPHTTPHTRNTPAWK
jgi:uncharacterized protein with von Willebrand factor type A (vWA) domain